MIFSGNIIYNESTLTYNDLNTQYGGVKDDLASTQLTNKIVDTGKPINNKVLDVKTSNKLIDKQSIGQTYYWRIYAGMPMGLLLSLTYPVDQDGEPRT
jgi:hypothetical protein